MEGGLVQKCMFYNKNGPLKGIIFHREMVTQTQMVSDFGRQMTLLGAKLVQ